MDNNTEPLFCLVQGKVGSLSQFQFLLRLLSFLGVAVSCVYLYCLGQRAVSGALSGDSTQDLEGGHGRGT